MLGAHSPQSAEKFIQEVFWRTYWKGWLELRPSVWANYQGALAQAKHDVMSQGGLRQQWEAACYGTTGIDCFDHWAKELVETGICTIMRGCGLPRSGCIRWNCLGNWVLISSCGTCWTGIPRQTHLAGGGYAGCIPLGKPILHVPIIFQNSQKAGFAQQGLHPMRAPWAPRSSQTDATIDPKCN